MAVPVLLQRLVAEIAPGSWVDVPRPYRVGRDSLIAPHGLEKIIAAASLQGGPRAGLLVLLVLLDADDDCPAELGPQLLARAEAATAGHRISVVLANREFEAWFLAAAPSLRGCRALASDLDRPPDAEAPRDCKGWLSDRRTDRRSYKPVADQAALASAFDLTMARQHSASFDKLWRDIELMVEAISKA